MTDDKPRETVQMPAAAERDDSEGRRSLAIDDHIVLDVTFYSGVDREAQFAVRWTAVHYLFQRQPKPGEVPEWSDRYGNPLMHLLRDAFHHVQRALGWPIDPAQVRYTIVRHRAPNDPFPPADPRPLELQPDMDPQPPPLPCPCCGGSLPRSPRR